MKDPKIRLSMTSEDLVLEQETGQSDEVSEYCRLLAKRRKRFRVTTPDLRVRDD
jgi:hypothetical protein